jgi:hypothetical protein
MRTNLLKQSEDFSTVWATAGDASVSTNQAIAPDGELTADELTASAGGANRVDQTIDAYTGARIYSFFVKQNDATHINVRAREAAGVDAHSDFEFSTATFNVGANVDSKSVQVLGNGWFRISITSTTSSTGTINVRIGGEISESSSGTKTYLWGAHSNSGSLPGPYIPTTTEAVSRAEDPFIAPSIITLN